MEYSLKPNLKKVFFSNFLTVIAVALGIIGIILYIDWIVGIEIFLLPFETFNIHLNVEHLTMKFVVGVISLAFLLGILNYISVKGMGFTFEKTKLRLDRKAYFILLSSKEVLYKDIYRVSHNNDGFFNTIFNSGCVVIELHNTKKIKLEFLDFPEKVSTHLQKIVGGFKKMEQAKFTETHKIEV